MLLLAVITEVRGHEKTVLGSRKISSAVSRQAVAVVVLGTAAVFVGILAISAVSDAPLREDTFEAISAFGTVGLSTGITPALPDLGRLGLIVTMLVGRVGPVTLGMALVLHRRSARTRLPQEAPLIG